MKKVYAKITGFTPLAQQPETMISHCHANLERDFHREWKIIIMGMPRSNNADAVKKKKNLLMLPEGFKCPRTSYATS